MAGSHLEPLLHYAERRAVLAVERSGSTSATRYWIAVASAERRRS
jgi:hypothetical protein